MKVGEVLGGGGGGGWGHITYWLLTTRSNSIYFRALGNFMEAEAFEANLKMKEMPEVSQPV